MKRHFNHYIFVLFMLINGLTLQAQSPTFIFKQLTLEHGLSENTIRGIIEDKQGYMWFCTESGLNRYDGINCKVFKFDQKDSCSLSNNIPRMIFSDSKGRLWIATRKGLNLYDPVNEKFYNYRSKNLIALNAINNEIEAVSEDKEGNIWALENNGGLHKISSLDKKAELFTYINSGGNSLFLSIKTNYHGNILIGSREGLLLFNVASKKYLDLTHKYGNDYEINSIFLDSLDNIWLATTQGLKFINQKNEIFRSFTNEKNNNSSINGNNVEDIVSYNGNNFLLGLDGAGLDYFDRKTEKFYHYSAKDDYQLNSNNLTSLYVDSKKNVWIGTFLNGVNYSNEASSMFVFKKNNYDAPSSVKFGIITSFDKDASGNFWVGTDGGGLFCKEKNSNIYKNFNLENGLASNIVITLLHHHNDLWITTFDGGLSRYNVLNKKFETFKHNSKNHNSLAGDRLGPAIVYRNQLWVGVGGIGIDVMDLKSKNFRHHKVYTTSKDSLPSEWVLNFLVDRDSVLWVATFNGLCRYNADTKTFKTFHFNNKEDNKPRDYVYDIFEDKQGVIWMGTKGGGLVKFDKHLKTYKVFTTNQGLVSNDINVICPDEYSNIWIGANNGITKFNIKSETGAAYNVNDGVPPTSFYMKAQLKTQDGKIYFGASGGYLIIDPKMAKDNPYIPPVVITSLNISGKPVLAGNYFINDKASNKEKNLILNYRQNALHIEFASLNFNNPSKNKYVYMLEGFENKWSTPSNKNFATYTNLDPGKYTFKLIASNNSGLWNRKGVKLNFEIQPPFWKTWYFLTFAFIGLLLIIFMLFRWRMQRIQYQNRKLEETVKNRTVELRESNNQMEAFVYQASHDIKGPLRSIIGLTKVGLSDVKDPVSVTYFQHILQSTTKLDKFLHELLELTRVKREGMCKVKIPVRNTVMEIIESFRHHPNFAKINFVVEVNEDVQFYSDQHLFNSIVQNLIENPIKYPDLKKNTNTLLIDIKIREKECLMKFHDNGPGISDLYISKIFDMFFKVDNKTDGTGLGLFLVKTTVEKLEGKITVNSKEGAGTTFSVTLKNFKNDTIPKNAIVP